MIAHEMVLNGLNSDKWCDQITSLSAIEAVVEICQSTWGQELEALVSACGNALGFEGYNAMYVQYYGLKTLQQLSITFGGESYQFQEKYHSVIMPTLTQIFPNS